MIIKWNFSVRSNIVIDFNKTIHRRGLDLQADVGICSLKSGALKNFPNFRGKQLLESFLIKLQAFRLEACNFFQKRLYGDLHEDSNTGVFLWNLQNLQEHLFVQNNSSGCFSILILKIVHVSCSVFCNFHNWMYKGPVLNFWNWFWVKCLYATKAFI